MPPDIYISLLHAVEHLRDNILEMNPNANIERLNQDIQELYDMVNGYDATE